MLTLLKETRDATRQNGCRCKCSPNQNESSMASNSQTIVLESGNQTQANSKESQKKSSTQANGKSGENASTQSNQSTDSENIQPANTQSSSSADNDQIQNVEVWSSGTDTIEVIIEKQSDENAESAESGEIAGEIVAVIENDATVDGEGQTSKDNFNEAVMTAIFKDAIEK